MFLYRRRLQRQSPHKTTGLVEDEYDESGMGKRLFPRYVKTIIITVEWLSYTVECLLAEQI